MHPNKIGWLIQAIIILMLAIIIALLIYLVTEKPGRALTSRGALPALTSDMRDRASVPSPLVPWSS
ncbi:MAG TPA: hypothetical protein VG815_17685 [Chloroflexota bacterium]|jgi:peptidoglycan/LPS O-acetylase OafA/YrhL|nr:hypothetical protein [Chloroflexota bacterium]